MNVMTVLCTACGVVGDHEELPDQPVGGNVVRLRCRVEGCGEVFEIAVWPSLAALDALQQLPTASSVDDLNAQLD